MNCIDAQDLLQQRLDGAAVPERAALAEHLAGCADCRTLHTAGAQLEIGLRQLPALTPPAFLSARLTARVLAERRARQRRRWLMGSALAASVLLAGLFAYPWGGESFALVRHARAWWQGAPPVLVAPPTQLAQPTAVPTGPSFRDGMAEAGSAVVALTRRTRAETVEHTKLLTGTLPTADPMQVLEALPPAVEQPMTTVLQETSQHVSAGFEPVTSSAKRAFRMFVRETPAAPAK